nr:DEAD/DEAH box helicase [Methylocystis sp. SC2]
MPTSAGKTRVAEIAALMTLSSARRVLIVTPLRALSAQTERSFRKIFAPLGFSVSSLYGTSGLSAGDEDALRSREIVIATPEKLDFALRSDPALIDDVGLIVLDEGQMIGPSESEIATRGSSSGCCGGRMQPSGGSSAFRRSSRAGTNSRPDGLDPRRRAGRCGAIRLAPDAHRPLSR